MHVMRSTVPISRNLPKKFNDNVNQVEAAQSTMGRYITEIWSQKQRFGGEQPHTESKLLRADTNCGFKAVLSAILSRLCKDKLAFLRATIYWTTTSVLLWVYGSWVVPEGDSTPDNNRYASWWGKRRDHAHQTQDGTGQWRRRYI